MVWRMCGLTHTWSYFVLRGVTRYSVTAPPRSAVRVVVVERGFLPPQRRAPKQEATRPRVAVNKQLKAHLQEMGMPKQSMARGPDGSRGFGRGRGRVPDASATSPTAALPTLPTPPAAVVVGAAAPPPVPANGQFDNAN